MLAGARQYMESSGFAGSVVQGAPFDRNAYIVRDAGQNAGWNSPYVFVTEVAPQDAGGPWTMEFSMTFLGGNTSDAKILETGVLGVPDNAIFGFAAYGGGWATGFSETPNENLRATSWDCSGRDTGDTYRYAKHFKWMVDGARRYDFRFDGENGTVTLNGADIRTTAQVSGLTPSTPLFGPAFCTDYHYPSAGFGARWGRYKLFGWTDNVGLWFRFHGLRVWDASGKMFVDAAPAELNGNAGVYDFATGRFWKAEGNGGMSYYEE